VARVAGRLLPADAGIGAYLLFFRRFVWLTARGGQLVSARFRDKGRHSAVRSRRDEETLLRASL
jgi:hypothetical protein